MTSNLKGLFELALHIPSPWFIEEVLFDEKLRQLNIKIDFHKGSEFFYEDEALGISGKCKVYDTVEKQWRHLNLFEHECYLHACVPRAQTPDGHVRLIQAPWAGQRNGFTLLFEALVLSLLEVMPVHRVGQLLRLSDYKLWLLLDTYITLTRAQEDYSKVTQVGMDETAKRKQHDYVTLFVDMNERKTLFITEGKSHATVKAFSEDLTTHHAESIQISEVSCDMSLGFIKGVQEYLPNANITFDKFHIIKIINEAVDFVRKQEVREQPELRGKRFIFLKNRENLTQKQKEVLTAFSLAKQKLKTFRALQMREAFQDIYQTPTVEVFEHLLKKWCGWAHRSRLIPIKMVAQMLKTRWDRVIRWKTSQINNGILEGLNSLIQAAKAKARGYKTFRCMQLITYLLTAKRDFTVLNKYHLFT